MSIEPAAADGLRRRLLSDLADLVALAYHEARNVRHLVRTSAVPPANWRHVIALPTNRNQSWTALQEVRRTAKSVVSAEDVLAVFERRFRVSLLDLEELYGHPAWRHSAYGGNAWLQVSKAVSQFADCLGGDRLAEAAKAHQALLEMRHNTGTVAEKLRRLDDSLAMSGD